MLSRIGDPEAVPVLTGALRDHDADFTRAEAALRVDLAYAHLMAGDRAAADEQRRAAVVVIDAVGSVRQRARLDTCLAGSALIN
jgi:HEAT repeat protein